MRREPWYLGVSLDEYIAAQSRCERERGRERARGTRGDRERSRDTRGGLGTAVRRWPGRRRAG